MPDDELLQRLKTALADRYDVEQELGHGGMAIVYLARDIKHDRSVALKVMRPELAASIGGERFLREIAIEAKLSHPHILPLYDSGEAEGILYYVMPFVEGESLRDLLDREQQLSLDDAVRIIREVAEALSHAHSYDIIHRDIKPENIMLSGGHAVVADFGIARAVSAAGGDSLTQTGMSLGTPAYMSPEQAMGDEHIDGRTDIYSLGCVLYEALVGQVPFTGPTAQAVMARHTMDAVSPPSIMRQSVTEELELIVLQAMEKSPADRFRTANEMAEALAGATSGGYAVRRRTTMAMTSAQRALASRRRRLKVALPAAAVTLVVLALVVWRIVSGGDGTPPVVGGLDARNVAVLYFEDLSSDGSLTHIADGFTEGLIAQLATVRGLRVRSRNAVAPYRDAVVGPDSIARALEVGSVIKGAIEQVGDDLRVTVRLIEGTSGVDFQRESFQHPVSQLLAAQDSVVVETSRLLRARLGEEVRTRERRASTSSTDAWALVQRAERLRKSAETAAESGDVDGALDMLLQADSLLAVAEGGDEHWVEPTVLRGWVVYRRARLTDEDRAAESMLDEARRHSDRVLEVEPANGRALELRGTAAYYRWYRYRPSDRDEADQQFAGAKADLVQATQIEPALATAHSTLSRLYRHAGEGTSAVLAARRAYEEDAYLQIADQILNDLFWGTYTIEEHTQGLDWCTEGSRRFPNDRRFTECRLWLMTTDALDPDVEEAWGLAGQVELLTPEQDREFTNRAMRLLVGGVLARAGLEDSARHVLEAARADPDLDPMRSLLYTEAYMRVLVGDDDEAIDLLSRFHAANPEEDHGEGDSGEVFWWWRNLQNHPRWREAVRGRR